MFIVFNGKGWVAPISALGAMVLTLPFQPGAQWLLWIAIAASGVVDHQVGMRANGASPRMLKDLETGEVLEEYPDHSFFWIPLQYWLWIKVFFAVSAFAAYLTSRYDI